MFGFGKPIRPKAVAFDIIGTVFPLQPLRPLLGNLGLPPEALETVYAATLRDAFTLTATGDFEPFTTVFAAALGQVLAQHGLNPPAKARATVIEQLKYLPPRPDAREAFYLLNKAGLPVIALTNGAAAATKSLLQLARLSDLVAHIVSVEDLQRFKPDAKVYRRAAITVGIKPGRLAMVAIHPWDIHGAKAAGLNTAYVAVDAPFPPIFRKPDIIAPSLAAAARALLKQ